MAKSQKMPRPPATRMRCAIYTRKSSEEGLEQAFNSLDAQREACAAFILSQRHEGWAVLPTQYDDGGFSGGTIERPALKRLLDDIATGKVDVVVVYKIDRLTRSLFDFAKIVEAFDAKGVSFVSITQQFNTTTSMGRLTLNVLLSFAQFEREVTGERIRDKIAASKKKGMWMGGLPALGYDVQNRKLVINEQEALTVRISFSATFRFDRYVFYGRSSMTRGSGANGGSLPMGPRLVVKVLPWRPLSDASEPHLSRRDHAQRHCLSRRAPADYRQGAMGPGSNGACREPDRSSNRIGCKASAICSPAWLLTRTASD